MVTDASRTWAGWIVFAAIMMLLVAFMNGIQGIAALAEDEYYARAGDGNLLVFDFTEWGWILLISAVVLVATAIGLLAGAGWARWLGIFLVGLNMLGQAAFLGAFPIWTLIVIALEVTVLYALTVRWEEARVAIRARE